MLYGMFTGRPMSETMFRLNSSNIRFGCSAFTWPSFQPAGKVVATFDSRSTVSIGLVATASPSGGESVYVTIAICAAVSAALSVASRKRRRMLPIVRLDMMRGMPRCCPGRSAENRWIMSAALTVS